MDFTLNISGEYLDIIPTGCLVANRVYTITVDTGVSGVYNSTSYAMENEYVFWFTSTYCPLFTTLTKVKLQAGPMADSLTDDTIYRLIHKNSMDAVDILNAYRGTNYAYDEWGCTWHDVPLQLRQYVECKTAFDILSLLDIANMGGDQTKTLGDMTIKYAAAGKSSPTDPNRKQQLYNCWNEALDSIKGPGMRVAIRGKYDTSKGFPHPRYDTTHNRIQKHIHSHNSSPRGPWERASDWIGRH
jgi:hypothetical protein